jgi:type IV pilus assembly protein PilV
VNTDVNINRKNEFGFTLIEILIAVVIMGVGLLITAKMQLVAIQNTQGGYMRSQAANIGYDIIDRMRTNIPAVTNGDYDIAAGDGQPAPIDCKGNDANCSTGQMAQFDHFWWRETIGEFLPNGTGSIVTADNGTFTKVTITLSWLDPYSVAQGAEQNVFTAELPR